MDTQQLKLLAEQVRGLLQQSNHSIGHSQSLDVIAALPGLRNWPEVQAFPNRVAACELDLASTHRLSFRLKRKFEVDLPANELLTALAPSDTNVQRNAPQIWPAGPAPGVYLTTSQGAIDALIQRYEEASDGALFYADGTAGSTDDSIPIGDYGLWSNGLSRVPSGTLVVVGPIELDQQSWKSSSERLEMACLDALLADHRVAVLVETPMPENLCEDALLMVGTIQPDGADNETALLGIVTDDGEMERRVPFAKSRPLPVVVPAISMPDALPRSTRAALASVLAQHRTGLVMFGSDNITEHSAIELTAAALALTEHAGPVARIMPRHRSTPSKDWDVPEAIKQIPYLPSVESAYTQGYRRFVIDPLYIKADVLIEYGANALFLANIYDSSVEKVFMSAVRFSHPDDYAEMLSMVVAILGVKPMPTKRGEVTASDLYVAGDHLVPTTVDYDDVDAFLRDHRVIRWQDEMDALLNKKVISQATLKKLFQRDQGVKDFLAERTATSKMHERGK
jgi:hypothetical protein